MKWDWWCWQIWVGSCLAHPAQQLLGHTTNNFLDLLVPTGVRFWPVKSQRRGFQFPPEKKTKNHKIVFQNWQKFQNFQIKTHSEGVTGSWRVPWRWDVAQNFEVMFWSVDYPSWNRRQTTVSLYCRPGSSLIHLDYRDRSVPLVK